jgi:hypothetical protein
MRTVMLDFPLLALCLIAAALSFATPRQDGGSIERREGRHRPDVRPRSASRAESHPAIRRAQGRAA